MTTLSRPTHVALIALVLSLVAAPVFAHEGENHETEAEAAAHLQIQAAPVLKPLDAVKARAQEIKQNAMRTAPNASGTPPMRVIERQIGARVVETGSSTPRGQLTSLVRTHLGNIEKRLSGVLAHLTRFLERVEARIGKMEASGADVEAILALHTDAVAAVAIAEADVASLTAVIGSVSEADDRTTVRARINAAVEKAQRSVREAHKAVRTVVIALVAAAKADVGVEVEAGVEVE